MKFSPFLLAVICLTLSIASAHAEKIATVRQVTLDANDAQKTLDAAKFDGMVNQFRTKLEKADCWASKHDNDALTCPCQFKEDIATLESAYELLVRLYPTWEGDHTAIQYTDPTSKQSEILQFGVVHNQMLACKSYK